MKCVIISAYKFIELGRLAERRANLRERCQAVKLKGTILLGPEGINLVLAGDRESIEAFKIYLSADAYFSDLYFKESNADAQPFKRMFVKLKKEIITLGLGEIKTQHHARSAMKPKELQQWLEEGRDFTLLDVRNDYEVEIGTFEKAESLGIKTFRAFPNSLTQKFQPQAQDKPVVIFCTGGIRCEKALPWMVEQGFTEVYQLDGGILAYFNECGGSHYRGQCFVFDDRTVVDPNK